MLTQMTQMNETHKMYASYIAAQNAKIESLQAETRNLALRLTEGKTDVLNIMHQLVDELTRNRGFKAMGKQCGPRTVPPPSSPSVKLDLTRQPLISV